MTTIGLFLLLIFLPFSGIRADVMNLNEFMPTRLEDASVLPHGSWQLQGTARYSEENQRSHFRPSFRWGVLDNLQLEVFQESFSGPKGTEQGSGETQVALQWYIHDQHDWVPAVAVAPQFSFPTGKASEGIDPSLKIFFSQTISGTSKKPISGLHLNYQYEHNASRQQREDKINKLLVFGYNHKIGSSTSLIADFVHEKDITGESVNEVELGCLQEFSPSWILGPGVALDVHEGYFSYSLAIQKTF